MVLYARKLAASGGGGDSGFCTPLNFTAFILQGTQILSFPGVGQVRATSQGSAQRRNEVKSSASFTSTTSKVQGECYFDASSGGDSISGVAFYDGDPMSDNSTLICSVGYLPNSGTIIDGRTGSPLAVGVTMNAGDYKIAAALDSAAGTAEFKDNRPTPNSGALDVLGTYSNANPVFMGAAPNADTANGATMDISANFGRIAFEIDITDAVSHCNATP